mgnify:CR=1 FL=1
MKTSTIVVIGILGLAATPLALHLAGGSTSTTKNWIKTLHGGGSGAAHGGSAAPEALQKVQDKQPAPKSAAATLAGKWTVTITSEQGDITSTMVLTQEGRKIAGTFANPHGEGDLVVVGELADGAVTLNVDAAVDHGEMHLAFKGAVKGDGSLAGTMASAMGDATWTAVRVKDKQ